MPYPYENKQYFYALSYTHRKISTSTCTLVKMLRILKVLIKEDWTLIGSRWN